MSKIICDVCGTSYPDTATQCPICGCVRSADVEAVIGGQDAPQSESRGTYTYVKGGRFSKANVKKRNSGKPVATASAPAKPAAPAKAPVKEPVMAAAPEMEEVDVPVKSAPSAPKQKSNLGLIIVIIVLLLAIVAVLSYIALRFVVPGVFGTDSGSDYVSSLATDPTETLEPENVEIACTAIELSDIEVVLVEEGEIYQLAVIPTPLNTTDEITFVSENEEVATVDVDGVITAIAEGDTTIVVTCGEKVVRCAVLCTFVNNITDELVLDAEEHTFTAKGEPWVCYTGTINVDEITWTSDDTNVATIEKGVVTAVGAGTTNIRAKYGEQEVSCAILCADTVNTTTYTPPAETTPTEEEEDEAEEQETTTPTTAPTTPAESTGTPNANYKFNTHDKNEMMLGVGESFSLRLLDENGKTLSDVKFSSSNESVCTVSEKGTVKCVGYGGTVTISAVYNGATYKCKVYIR